MTSAVLVYRHFHIYSAEDFGFEDIKSPNDADGDGIDDLRVRVDLAVILRGRAALFARIDTREIAGVSDRRKDILTRREYVDLTLSVV